MSVQPNFSLQIRPYQFKKQIFDEARLEIYHETEKSSQNSIFDDMEDGLTSRPKYLLPKYFYDNRGSELFEKITGTREYYPTRTEKSILQDSVKELCTISKDINVIVELGSGSSEKTRILLDEFLLRHNSINYIPIDISDVVIDSSRNLCDKFKNLYISGIISDYDKGLSLIAQINKNPKLVIFLGSSIGNFALPEIIEFLSMTRESLDKDDRLLIGFDMEKDRKVLHAAYNDAKGITGQFNLNILKRLNRELGAEFELNNFRHYAFFNEKHSRIEMHIVSKEDQEVRIKGLDLTVHFRSGETIHTENSYKFSDEMIQDIAFRSGFNIINSWKDIKQYFALILFQPA
jgi:dimethylhistidine N-methyltransferase